MPTLAFDVLWADKGASRGMQNLGRDTEATGKKFSKFKAIAATAGLAAGVAILKFGKDSVVAYKESEDAQKKLAFAFQKFPALAGTNQAALQKLNSELQKKTRFDDDNIASGQAVLAQFKLTGKQITETTPLLLDYAAATGKDVPAAAQDLGKALLGNAKALKNIGISYKSTGDSSKDFANITELMRQKVGGFADQEGKTASGRLAILKNQFGELQEAAGAKLVPALSGIVEKLTVMVGFVDRNKAVIGPLVGVTAALAAAIWLAQKASVAFSTAQSLNTGFATKAVGGLTALKTAFTGVGLSASAAGRAMKIAQLSIPVVGVALFAVTTAMQLFAAKSSEGTAEANDFSAAMGSIEGKVTRATAALNEQVRAQAVSALQSAGALDQAKMLGLSYGTVTDAALGNRDAIAEVNRVVLAASQLNPALSKSNSELRNAAIGLSGSLNGVATESKSATEAEIQRRGAMQAGATVTNEYQAATATLGDKTAALTGKHKELNAEIQKSIDKFTILRDGALSQESANIGWQRAVDNVRRSVKENGRSLDVHSEKGRKNREAIADAARAMNDKAAADFAATSKSKGLKVATEQASDRLRTNKKTLREAAIAAGFNKTEIDAMIRKMLKTPKKLETDIKTKNMAKVLGEIEDLKKDIRNLRDKLLKLKVQYSSSGSVKISTSRRNGATSSGPGRAAGGVLPGYTPGRDVHHFTSPTGGNLHLSGGEGILIPQATRAVGGSAGIKRINDAARKGQRFEDGGVVRRNLIVGGDTGNHPNVAGAYASAVHVATTAAEGAARTLAKKYAAAEVKRQKAAIKKAKAAASGGPVSGGGFAKALSYARRNEGHPYIFGSMWDCSGFISALHNIILGKGPGGRRYSTPAFHGAHAQGFTRGKRSPFMIGVNPSPGRFGHMAGTLNGVNVESAGGVGVRVGGGARGHNSGMFSWRGGLARGGVIGDLPYDLLDPRGQRYDPALALMVKRLGYGGSAARGGVVNQRSMVQVAERGPERILTTRQNENFERLVRVMDHSGTRGGNITVIVNAPHLLGSPRDLVDALVPALTTLNRQGRLTAIKSR